MVCLTPAKSPATERGVCPLCHCETKPGGQLYEDGSCWPQCLGTRCRPRLSSNARSIMRAALRKADVNVDRMQDEELAQRYEVLTKLVLEEFRESMRGEQVS